LGALQLAVQAQKPHVQNESIRALHQLKMDSLALQVLDPFLTETPLFSKADLGEPRAPQAHRQGGIVCIAA
jgi:hypothetical protein